jgi:RNase P subunit RPR2
MRVCKNCGSEMVEGYKVKINNATILANMSIAKKGFSEKPTVAVCPDCGEISLYIENIDKVK